MSQYRAGAQLRVTDTGELLTIWSEAHLPGCYWAHLGTGDDRPVVLVRVRNVKTSTHPVVTFVNDS
jgi:hypothetical protein